MIPRRRSESRRFTLVRLSLPSEDLRPGEDVVEHLLGETTSKGVLLRYVVAAQQREAIINGHLNPMAELGSRPDVKVASDRRRTNTAEGDQYSKV